MNKHQCQHLVPQHRLCKFTGKNKNDPVRIFNTGIEFDIGRTDRRCRGEIIEPIAPMTIDERKITNSFCQDYFYKTSENEACISDIENYVKTEKQNCIKRESLFFELARQDNGSSSEVFNIINEIKRSKQVYSSKKNSYVIPPILKYYDNKYFAGLKLMYLVSPNEKLLMPEKGIIHTNLYALLYGIDVDYNSITSARLLGTILIYPIRPRTAICLFDENSYMKYSAKSDISIEMDNTDENRLIQFILNHSNEVMLTDDDITSEDLRAMKSNYKPYEFSKNFLSGHGFQVRESKINITDALPERKEISSRPQTLV